MIEKHPLATVSSLADVEDSTRGTRIVFEEHVVVDSFVKIKPAGGTGDLVIQRNTIVNSGCVFYTGNGISIGRYVSIAANCCFAPVNHKFQSRKTRIQSQGFLESKGGIVIGDDAWIGAGCVILDGADIGEGCVVGAGSLVRGRLDAYGIYAGNPIAKIGEREMD